ncbi:MAG: site-specific integrase [Ruminococcus sp.]|nr:site-specific integrase [Ruminococcus sp.]
MSRRGDNIHKRKDGRWEGRYKDGFRADGTTKYSSVYAHSYSECKKKLTEAQSSFTNKAKKCNSEKLFSDILFNWLFSNQIRLKGGTEAKYTNVIETHIIPGLGGLKLSMIDSTVINSFLERQLNFGGIKNGEALSPSYVRTMAIVIEAAYNYAVMEGLCYPLKTPINKPSIPKKDIVILSKQAETTLTQILVGNPSRVAIGTLIALQTGLRIGEVCALRWCDVDFENNVIHIRHTISRVPSPNSENKTILILDTPKTKSSVRDVPIPSSLRRVLLIEFQNKSSEYVVSDNHTFVGTRTFDYRYRQLLKKHNIQVFSFHTLRHTYATRCARSGMDAKTLSRLLGHSSSNTTLNIYVHPSFEIAMQHLEQIYCSA